MEYVRFMEKLRPLNAVNDALGCVCRQLATAECRKNETEVHELKRGKIVLLRTNGFQRLLLGAL